MYSIENKNEAVRNVQSKLLAIEYENENTKTLPIDGIYGTETADAVTRFQKKAGLSPSGKVDMETFKVLCTEAARAENLARERKMTENDPFPLAVTSQGVYVEILQNVLNRLSERFGDRTYAFHSGYYSDRTEAAVKFVQQKMQMPVTGTVTREFMDCLLKVLNSIEK